MVLLGRRMDLAHHPDDRRFFCPVAEVPDRVDGAEPRSPPKHPAQPAVPILEETTVGAQRILVRGGWSESLLKHRERLSGGGRRSSRRRLGRRRGGAQPRLRGDP
ncbi:MAG: hypothetical protein M1606_03495, partial [Candidatus Thermoplasmatota archaeon]|nr:hypothetical protein [Candidatus Thermoplasmatota archaeon]